MILDQIYEQVGTAIWLVGCLLALWRGARPERMVATALLIDLASFVLLPGLSPRDQVSWWAVIGDIAVLAYMAWVRRAHGRAWLSISLGFQFLAILAHIPRILDPGIHSWGYSSVTNLCGYAVVLALSVGALTRSASERSHAHTTI